MADTTPLDTAILRMQAAPEDEAARLAFHGTLADTPLWLLLDAEPESDAIAPRLIETGQGAVVVAFDSEDRLAAFAQAIAPHAAMPGRALVRLLAGQGLGLGINVGVSEAETVVDPEALEWLAKLLSDALPSASEARPEHIGPPGALPPGLLTALDTRLARAGGLARSAYLAAVHYTDGRRGHLLAIIDPAPGAEPALTRAIAEAVRFADAGDAAFDVAFFSADDPVSARIAAAALRFDLPEPTEPAQQRAPGSDPDAPPILR